MMPRRHLASSSSSSSRSMDYDYGHGAVGALLEMAAKHILHTHPLFLAAEEKERRKEGREQDAAGLMR